MISLNNTRPQHYKKHFAVDAADIFDLHAYSNPLPGERQYRLVKYAQKYLFAENSKIFILTIRAFNDPSKEWNDTTTDSITRTFDFYERSQNKVENFGFYGWSLNPNVGIDSLPDVKVQVRRALMDK